MSDFPDLTVNGILIKQESQIQALKLFLQNDGRQAKHLETFLEDLGVPVYHGIYLNQNKLVANRVADRLLQKARKIGIIKFEKGRWVNSYAARAFLEGALT